MFIAFLPLKSFPAPLIKHRFHWMEMYSTASALVSQDQSVLKPYEIILI